MATVEVNQMAFGQNFIAPDKNNQHVPNHLLDTKIFSKVAENDVFQASPSSLHFAGFELNKTSKKVLKLTNISLQCQRMHVISPTTSYYKIKYVKKERLVPGFFMEIEVEFTPSEWRYYYDCIRIHCQSSENLIIPLHGYPALNLSEFPRKLDFGTIAVGERKVKTISLKSDIPVNFEFQISLLQSLPAIKVEPRQGVIPGNGALDIKVTFSPTEFCTMHSKLQLLISQFNASPQVCHVTGCSAPGLKLKLLGVTDRDIGEEAESMERSKTLDPVTIDPVYRSRLKKQGKSQKLSTTSDKNVEVIHNGIRFPKNLVTPSAVSYVLQQQPGKIKAKDIREAVKQRKSIPLSTKQLKETVFEYKVQQDITEERQNQLRWCVKLGQDEMSQLEKNKILEERAQGETEYKLQRGDPIVDVEFDRSTTSCSQERIHRQANTNPEYTARFDFFVNDDWTKRHRVLRRFVQAGRKVIIRRRAARYLESLNQYLTEWKGAEFQQDSARTHHAKSVEDNISTPLLLERNLVAPFSFPLFTTADENDDRIAQPVGKLPVEPTAVYVEPHIPFFKLKVPQQYALLGYKPHNTRLSAIGHIPRNAVRPLRTGAEDEIINAGSSLPHTNDPNANILQIRPNDEGDLSPSSGENATNEIQMLAEDLDGHREDVTTAGGKSRLVIPSSFFKKPKFHPLEIFNPLPSLHVLQPQVFYSKVEEDYHLCPLPRYKLTNKSASNKPSRPFIERSDVISGLMTWKRFPCQSLVSSNNVPNITDVWIPRWTSPFIDDLLPHETPEVLQELPDDDAMSDTDSHDEEITDTPANPAVLTPEMVSAMFPLVRTTPRQEEQSGETFPQNGKLPSNNNPVSSRGVISRSECEKDLSIYVETCYDRLGRAVRQRLQDMNNVIKDENLKTTLQSLEF